MSFVVHAWVAFWRRIAGRLYFVGLLALLAVAALGAASIYFAWLTGRATQEVYEHGLVGMVDATEIEILLEKHRRIVETAPSAASRNQVTRQRRLAEAYYTRIEDLTANSNDALALRIASGLPPLGESARRVLLYAENFARDNVDE